MRNKHVVYVSQKKKKKTHDRIGPALQLSFGLQFARAVAVVVQPPRRRRRIANDERVAIAGGDSRRVKVGIEASERAQSRGVRGDVVQQRPRVQYEPRQRAHEQHVVLAQAGVRAVDVDRRRRVRVAKLEKRRTTCDS